MHTCKGDLEGGGGTMKYYKSYQAFCGLRKNKPSKTKGIVDYNRLTSFWGTCARSKSSVFMYLSKQSDDRRPKTLISQSDKFAETAAVTAPIRNRSPAYSLDLRTPSLRYSESSFPCEFILG